MIIIAIITKMMFTQDVKCSGCVSLVDGALWTTNEILPLCFAAMEISAGKMHQILRRMQSCIVVGVFCITK